MDAEIARHDRMSESGSSLLRLIQNESTPLLDLFVREAVQNSLDAVKDNADHVNVDLISGSFEPARLNKHFDRISDALNNRFPDNKHRFLSIRDSNTVGLTGPVHSDEVSNPAEFGNLLKLVYEICKPQQKDGAGGSWGLGKTIYFRLGIGLVLYYSRIFQDGQYQSRLAACFVEDERKADAFIPKEEKIGRGIAWWGKSVGDNKTVPLADEQEINSVLEVFNIKPYEGEETGTTVIIPYIDENKLLSDCYTEQINDEGEKVGEKPYWLNSVAEYLTVGIQRWYAPRLLNRKYPGARLVATVNGQKLKVSQMLPLFRILREFYTIAITDNKLDDESYISENEINVKSEKIYLRTVFADGGCAGTLIFAEVTGKQLHMTPPDNIPDPFSQIINSLYDNSDGNPPIVTFVRRPAMIVSYDFKGPWTRDLQRSTPDSYIVGIFVLESDKRIKDCHKFSPDEELTVEEYIRSGEKADHAEWCDQSINGKKYDIVDRIQRLVSNKIAKTFNAKAEIPDSKRNIGLGHTLASILLPPEDFGKAAVRSQSGGSAGGKGVPGGSAGFGAGGRSHKSSYFIVTGNTQYTDDGIIATFETFLKNKELTISLNVIAGNDSYNALSWEDDEKGIGVRFPFAIIRLNVDSIRKNVRYDFIQGNFTVTGNEPLNEEICISILKSVKFATPYAVRITVPEAGYTFRGRILFRSEDDGLMYNFRLKED